MHGAVVLMVSSDWSMLTDSPYKNIQTLYYTSVYTRGEDWIYLNNSQQWLLI